MRYSSTYRILAAALALCWAAAASASPGHQHRASRQAHAEPSRAGSKPAAPAAPAPAAAADAGSNQPAPQSFSAEAPPTAGFGQVFPYTIRVTHPKGEVYALPREASFGDYDLVSSAKEDQPKGDAVVTVFNLQLRAWAVGKKAIPELSLEVTTAAGESTLKIPGPTVDVQGTLNPDGGELALRDIAAPVDLPVRTWRYLIALAIALGVGALAFIITKQLRKPKPAYVPPPVPPEPAHVRARKALEALLTEDLAGHGRQRELFFRLSEIERRYLGEVFGFDAIDLTTEELLTALRKRPTPGLDLTAFARDCQDADLVKFAKLQPDANACKAAVDAALARVDATHAATAVREASA